MTIEYSALIRTSILPPPNPGTTIGNGERDSLKVKNGESPRLHFLLESVAGVLMNTQQLLLHVQDPHKNNRHVSRRGLHWAL